MGQAREILCLREKKIDEKYSQKVIMSTMRHFQYPGVQFVPLAALCRVLQENALVRHPSVRPLLTAIYMQGKIFYFIYLFFLDFWYLHEIFSGRC